MMENGNTLENITIKQSESPALMKQQTFTNSASDENNLKEGVTLSNGSSKISGQYRLFKTPSNKSQKDDSLPQKPDQYKDELY